ncbi:MAG: hypothetical protein VX938_13020, partial [Myxococcota bacterium]|nr:hypothetical protein [Myxococcota bacterium]
ISSPALEAMGLPALTAVGGGLEITGTALTTLDGLSALTSIGGDIAIYDNAALCQGYVDAFVQACVDCVDTANVSGNTGACPGDPVSCAADFVVDSEDTDGDLALVNGCTAIEGSLSIFETTLLSLDALTGLTSVTGDLSIYENPTLNSLAGIDGVTAVGGAVHIYNNPALCQNLVDAFLEGCEDCTADTAGGNTGPCDEDPVPCEGDYTVDGIDTEADLALLEGCPSITGGLTIQGTALENLDGLPALTTIGGGLAIHSNAALVNLDGLSTVGSIGGATDIVFNLSLQNLSGLSGLKTVGGYFQVTGNGSLTDISGLGSLESVGGEVAIYTNASLCQDDVDAVIASCAGCDTVGN